MFMKDTVKKVSYKATGSSKKTPTKIVEHIFSSDLNSAIFSHIFRYFKIYSSKFEHKSDFELKRDSEVLLNYENEAIDEESEIEPVQEETIFRIYHRPNLVEELVSPCACVVHHDLNDPSDAFDIKKYLDKYLVSDLVICLNKTQEKILNGLGVLKTVVIPHGYNKRLKNLKPSPKTENSKFVLGLFSKRYGRLVKGEAFLYELAMNLSPDSISFMLIGDQRAIDGEWLISMGFDVIYGENIPYPVLCKSYNDIDALLITSISEGAPASVPEALITNTPIIARPVGMIPDVFAKGSCGLILTDNAETDAKLIMYFLKNNMDESKKFIKKNKLVYSWKEIISKYEDSINIVLGNE